MGRRATRSNSQDLKRLLLSPAGGKFLRPIESFDQVFPGIYLGDAATALSSLLLKEIGVTHVLNAAHGKNDEYYGGFVNTSFSSYDRAGIKFMGVPALDTPSFYLRAYFKDAADFIESALKSGGKVLIHCQCGISRSATLIAAYLMLKKKMTAEQALSTIRAHRSIFPNQGFLSQLCDLEYELRRSGHISASSIEEPSDSKALKPLKDASYNPAFHSDRRPMFSYTNYLPIQRELSRSGYPISSGYYDFDVDSPYRSRSEERFPSDLYARGRNQLPSSSYRPLRSVSVIPESIYFRDRARSSSPAPEPKPVEQRASSVMPFLSSYETPTRTITRSYVRATSPEPSYYYTPRAWESPSVDTYLRPRYQSSYDPYVYTSPYARRSYYDYYPDSYYSSYSRPRYSSAFSDSYLGLPPDFVPSTLRYPSYIRDSYLTRIRA